MSLFTVIPQGPFFESNGRKQLSLSSCGWVLILSGQFIITDGSRKGKRRQGAKKMNTGDGKELTDKDEKEKELKVRMIRARKTGDTRWSSEVDWIWTGSLGR